VINIYYETRTVVAYIYRVSQRSKLLILITNVNNVNKTEKIGET